MRHTFRVHLLYRDTPRSQFAHLSLPPASTPTATASLRAHLATPDSPLNATRSAAVRLPPPAQSPES